MHRVSAAIAPSASHAGPGHVDALVGPAGVPLAVGPGRRAPDPIGVVGHERLGERDERGALRGGFLRQPPDLLDRRVPVAEDRGGLHCCDPRRWS